MEIRNEFCFPFPPLEFLSLVQNNMAAGSAYPKICLHSKSYGHTGYKTKFQGNLVPTRVSSRCCVYALVKTFRRKLFLSSPILVKRASYDTKRKKLLTVISRQFLDTILLIDTGNSFQF